MDIASQAMPCQAASAVRIVARRQKNVGRVQPAEQPRNRAMPNPSVRVFRARDAHWQNILLGVQPIPVIGITADGHNHSSRAARAAGLGATSEGAACGLGPAPGSICAYATLF